jgi:hypothetical protein
MYESITRMLEVASTERSVWVVLVEGSGAAFTAGNDIEEFLKSPQTSQDDAAFEFLNTLASFPKPVVAAVCGNAAGVGTTMLFHCDIVYAGENASFAMPFVTLGYAQRPDRDSWRRPPSDTTKPPRRSCSARGCRLLAPGSWAFVNEVLPPERVRDHESCGQGNWQPNHSPA